MEGVSGRKIRLPSPKTFISLLRDDTDILKENLKYLLSQQEYVCETIDAWTSRAISFIGITVHFLDETTLERKSYVLAFREVKFKQDHKNIAKFIHDVNKEFSLSPSKVRYAVTDGGSAFVKAFATYGNINDDDHIQGDENNGNGDINIINDEDHDEDAGDTFNGEDRVIDESEPAVILEDVVAVNLNLDSMQNIPVELNDSNVSSSDYGKEILLPKQFRCTAHNMNLVAGVDFWNNLEKSVAKSLHRLFSKLFVLWGTIRRRSRAKNFCKEICGCVLSIPNATRML